MSDLDVQDLGDIGQVNVDLLHKVAEEGDGRFCRFRDTVVDGWSRFLDFPNVGRDPVDILKSGSLQLDQVQGFPLFVLIEKISEGLMVSLSGDRRRGSPGFYSVDISHLESLLVTGKRGDLGITPGGDYKITFQLLDLVQGVVFIY